MILDAHDFAYPFSLECLRRIPIHLLIIGILHRHVLSPISVVCLSFSGRNTVYELRIYNKPIWSRTPVVSGRLVMVSLSLNPGMVSSWPSSKQPPEESFPMVLASRVNSTAITAWLVMLGVPLFADHDELVTAGKPVRHARLVTRIGSGVIRMKSSSFLQSERNGKAG